MGPFSQLPAEAASLYELQLLNIIESGQNQLSNILPSAWVEENVEMGDPRPGPYRYSYTPYCREIIDRLASSDPAKWIAVMKGLQIGISAGVIIPGMGFIIKESPANTYFTVGAPDLINKSVEKLDLMIDKAGLRPYIKPQVLRNRLNKSGDTNTKKDFSGGFINITTPNNHKEWRDVSLKYGFIDDFEAAKSASKESGSTRKLIEGRFAAYKDTHKIFYISTPERKAESNIEPAYLLGDQRKYLIPCPCCGEFIELRWNMPDGIGVIWDEPMPEGSGVVWKLNDDNSLDENSVGYVCQKCGDFFKDNDKQRLLNAGYWQPTKKSSKPGFYSYHISSLYAPAGMYDWKHYVHNYLEANPPNGSRNEAEHMTFMNTCLGVTYEPQSAVLSAKKLQRNVREYEIGIIPEQQSIADGNGRIVLLTCGADLNGKMAGFNSDVDDARLDYSVIAWAESGSAYFVIHGSIGTFIPRENTLKSKEDRLRWTYEHNAPMSVWPLFDKIVGTEYVTDTGRKMRIHTTSLDSGAYAAKGVYPYLDRTNNAVIAVKGKKEDEYVKDKLDASIFSQGKERPDLIILEVGLIKDRVSEYMNLNWDRNEDKQPPNFMNFPQPSKVSVEIKRSYALQIGKTYEAEALFGYSNFFEHFEAEHRTTVTDKAGITKFRWVKKNSSVQNHMFDCYIYNIAIKEYILSQLGKEYKIKDFQWRDYVSVVLGE